MSVILMEEGREGEEEDGFIQDQLFPHSAI